MKMYLGLQWRNAGVRHLGPADTLCIFYFFSIQLYVKALTVAAIF